MNLQYVIKSASEKESSLFYSSTERNHDALYGYIGHLRGDFGSGKEFCTTFWDHCEDLKTQIFKDELAVVINQLREVSGLLNSLPTMSAYCNTHAALNLSSRNEPAYGYKVETDAHSYYIRCCDVRGDYNFYIYCYYRERLTQFLETTNK